MISAFENPDMPPLMSQESQTPPWWKVAQSNAKGALGDPKQQIAMAMLTQQLSKMGNSMQPQPMQRRDPLAGFDLYGNPQG